VRRIRAERITFPLAEFYPPHFLVCRRACLLPQVLAFERNLIRGAEGLS
jgi:hypothetical protein